MLSAADVERCERCTAKIIWTITAAGKRMPVDAEPDEAGNQAVHKDGVGTVRSRAITADRPSLEGTEQRAMPHFATCAGPLLPRRPANSPPRPVRRPPQWWRTR